MNPIIELKEAKSIQENEIFNLFDKYLKSSNNFLPLQAYLQYLENENVDTFSSICHFKSFVNETSHSSNQNDAFYSLSINSSSNNSSLNNPSPTLSLMNKNKLLNESTTSPSTLLALNKLDSDIVIAQKLYKIIISIDYSPQTTSLDFISKSLEKIFEKISNEFNEFFKHCSQIEPQIYVTVLLWNTVYFQYNHNYNIQVGEAKCAKAGHVPFTILCHSKRLLKSNIHEMASFVFEKLLESKCLFLEPFKASLDSNSQQLINTDAENAQFNSPNQNKAFPGAHHTHQAKFISPSEDLVDNVIKMFNYFGINENSSSSIAPATLALSHHIHITDGLIYSTDMIKYLEKISKSSITFSFIYSGSNNLLPGSNISSGFGYLGDHFLMKFLAQMSNGFYAVIDENLEYLLIYSNSILYYHHVSIPTSKFAQLNKNEKLLNSSLNEENSEFNSETSNLSNMDSPNKSTDSSDNKSNTDSEVNNSGNNTDNEEIRDSFCQNDKSAIRSFEKIRNKAKFSAHYSSAKIGNRIAAGDKNFRAGKLKDLLSSNYEETPECKCIQKYEIAHKQQTLQQICRVRSQEGFYLVKVSRQLVKPQLAGSSKNQNSSVKSSPTKKPSQQNIKSANSYHLITLYFKRYFTQTIIFVYKISYQVPILNKASSGGGGGGAEAEHDLPIVDSSITPIAVVSSSETSVGNDAALNSSSTNAANQQNKSLTKSTASASNASPKLSVEIWLSWSFLHVKSKYQNLYLIEQVRQCLMLIKKSDLDSSFDVTSSMLNPPEILKLKEPLFKIILAQSNEANFYEANMHNRDQVSNLVFNMHNINYELNMRSNKSMEQELIEFAHAWIHLAFFKYSKSILYKYFGLHKVKLILENDRPVPDTASVLFDMKNTMMLMTLEMISNSINGPKNNSFKLNNNNNNPDYSYESYVDTSILSQEHIALLNSVGYGNVMSSSTSNIFKCQNSLNKLCVSLLYTYNCLLFILSVALRDIDFRFLRVLF